MAIPITFVFKPDDSLARDSQLTLKPSQDAMSSSRRRVRTRCNQGPPYPATLASNARYLASVPPPRTHSALSGGPPVIAFQAVPRVPGAYIAGWLSDYGSEGWGFEFLRACYSQGFRGSRNPVAGLTTGQLTTVVIRGPGVSLAFRAHAPNALSCPYRAPTDASCRPAPTA